MDAHHIELIGAWRAHLRYEREPENNLGSSQEVSEGVVLDYDGEGNLVGIDIDHASRKLDLRELVTNHIPLKAEV
jgi:uncharacterized protein YuzE